MPGTGSKTSHPAHPKGAGSSAKPKTPTTKPLPGTRPAPYSQDANREIFQEQQRKYANQLNTALPSYTDPFNGVDPLTALLAGMNGGTGGGGGGRSRGGGGASGPSAADKAAALQAIQGAYAQSGSALDQLLASQSQGFDQRSAELNNILGGANTRLSSLMGELGSRAGQAQQATQGAYAGGDQALQSLLAEYQAMAGGRDAAANQTLGAFGAGTVNPSGGGVGDMISAARVANTMRGNAANQLYADRSNVYNGLLGDAKSQYGATFDALLAKLAQDRQSASASVAQQKAQLALQQAQDEMRARGL